MAIAIASVYALKTETCEIIIAPDEKLLLCGFAKLNNDWVEQSVRETSDPYHR